MCPTREMRLDKGSKGVVIDAAVAVPHNSLVDLLGHNKNQGVCRPLEQALERRCVQEPEAEVKRFAETPAGVVEHLAGMHDCSQPQVIQLGQLLAEHRYDGVQ